MKGNISKVRGVLGSTGPKGDPSYPDWNQNDPTESDYIKNKPDLSLKEDKSNKVNSWDEIVSGDKSIEYPTVKFMEEELNNGCAGAIQDSKDYTNSKLVTKEDKSNKIQSVNDMSGSEEEYFSATGTLDLVNAAEESAKAHADGQYEELNKRVATNEESIADAFGNIQIHEQAIEQHSLAIGEIFGRIDVCGDFVKIYEDTLTESLTIIEKTFDTNYKELYIRFVIPCAYNEASTEKARFRVYTLNDSGGNVNKIIYDMGNWMVEDYKANNSATDWTASIRIKMLGNYARTELWYEMSNMFNNAYARTPSNSTLSGSVAPSASTKREYLPAIRVMLYSANNIRSFPAGTTYEMWGVKA